MTPCDQPTDRPENLLGRAPLGAERPSHLQAVGFRGSFQPVTRRDRGGNGWRPGLFRSTTRARRTEGSRLGTTWLAPRQDQTLCFEEWARIILLLF